jgi:hypothetical protein
MVRLKKYFFCLAVLLLSAGPPVHGQITVSATGHVIAEVISAYSAKETSQLNFGRFAPGPQGGEILLTPENTISVLGSVFAGIGVHNAASFVVTGDMDAAFTINLPEEPVILNHVSSAKTMMIREWISNPGTATGAGTLRNGSQVVYVGAKLKVGPIEENPAGVYAGTYTITFDFN